jgi:hypothetical protein
MGRPILGVLWVYNLVISLGVCCRF